MVTKEETVISIDPEEKTMHLQMEVLDHDYICMGNKSDSDKFMKDVGVQTDISMEDMNKATEELNQLAGLKNRLRNKEELKRSLFIDTITESDTSVQRYLGLPSLVALFGLFAIVDKLSPVMKYWRGKSGTHHKTNCQEDPNKRKSGPQRKLTRYQEFVLTLFRLRLALPTFLIANLFGISQTRVSQIFATLINYLDFVFSPQLKWPKSCRIKKFMPKCFQHLFPRTTCIIDCTEFLIEKPSSPTAQVQTYSSYKHKNTFKALVSITPTGAFSFVSDLWGGYVSDRYITQHCGILDHIKPGDEVMADRGFVIRDLMLERHATLHIPPFTKKCSWGKGKRLAPNDISKTKNIAKLRIHVERAIGRLKNFRTLANTIPYSLKPLCNQILRVTAFFCNLQKPLVK